jgi:hypothetical protein
MTSTVPTKNPGFRRTRDKCSFVLFFCFFDGTFVPP